MRFEEVKYVFQHTISGFYVLQVDLRGDTKIQYTNFFDEARTYKPDEPVTQKTWEFLKKQKDYKIIKKTKTVIIESKEVSDL